MADARVSSTFLATEENFYKGHDHDLVKIYFLFVMFTMLQYDILNIQPKFGLSNLKRDTKHTVHFEC